MILDIFVNPFYEYVFLRNAFIACCILALGCAPMGVLLVLRRMSLMGDALSHSVMPGMAVAYIYGGLSIPLMGLGGLLSSLLVAFMATVVTKRTQLKEDASFVSLYLMALAMGISLISMKGSAVDLSHILFGNILGIHSTSLILIASVTSLTLFILALVYRPLVMECFDAVYLQSIHRTPIHGLFMGLVVLNMVAAFQTMGVLMALGLMLLPAISARFWCQNLTHLFIMAFVMAILSVYGGLILSIHYNLPSGPAIILVASGFFVISLIMGPLGSFLKYRGTV